MTDNEILIVEDSLTQSLKLQHLLKQCGYQVTVARSGQEALFALAQQRLPAVVLSEIVIPDMDGYQLCREIKAQESGQEIAVILLNSFSDPDALLKTLECGADHWLAKPYHAQSLLSLLADLQTNRERWEAGRGATDSAAFFQGQEIPISSVPRFTLLSLLLTTYQTAVQRTQELREVTRTLELVESQGETRQPSDRDAVEGERSRILHVLIAEDSVVNQRFARRLLEKYGHTVTVAENGQEALKALEHEQFDLVLMDVEMPQMGGCETAAAIRRQEQTTRTHLPIFAMTAHDAPEQLDRCLTAGMDGYVLKPIRVPDLNRMLDQIAAMKVNPMPEETDAGIFDRAAAMSLVDDDTELLQEIVQLFLEGSPHQMEQIRLAVSSKDPKSLERAAHTLKGAAASISAPAVTAAARVLETLGRENDLTPADAAYAALEDAIEALTSVLLLGKENSHDYQRS